jgi:hypothetical protein
MISREQIDRPFLTNVMNQIPFDNPRLPLHILAKRSKTSKHSGTAGFQQRICSHVRQADANEPAGDLGNASAFAAGYPG